MSSKMQRHSFSYIRIIVAGENLRNGIKNLQSRIELLEVVRIVDKSVCVPDHNLKNLCSQTWLFIYLFICALTDDLVSISDFMTSTDNAICPQ
jgi:hypothetical protein